MFFLLELFRYQFWQVVVAQTILWIISLIIKNTTLVDVSWGVSQFLVAFSLATLDFTDFSYASQLNQIIGLSLVFIWMLRLSGFIFYYRIINRHVDARYEQNNIKQELYSFIQFELQGILLLFCCSALYYSFYQGRVLNILNYFGPALCWIGIVGEAIADFQLQRFKDNRTPDQDYYREGLFTHARHPNLFFELVFWFGITIYSIDFNNLWSLFSLLGPIILWAIMYFLTIPLTTKNMKKKRPNFQEVIDSTNVFLPF